MAEDWGYEDSSTDALAHLANLFDETIDSTADDEELRVVNVDGGGGGSSDSFSQSDTVQIKDTNNTPASGSASAVSLNLGDFRKDIDAFYDVSSTGGDVFVEVSTDGNFAGEEKSHTQLTDVQTGGELFQIETVYQYIRMYVGSGFSDGNVNGLEIVSRGT